MTDYTDLKAQFDEIKSSAVNAYGHQTDDMETMLMLRIICLDRLAKERLITCNAAVSRARGFEVALDAAQKRNSVALDVEARVKAAYLAGFNASGEGWNGEHPFQDTDCNPEADAKWRADRDKALSELETDNDRA